MRSLVSSLCLAPEQTLKPVCWSTRLCPNRTKKDYTPKNDSQPPFQAGHGSESFFQQDFASSFFRALKSVRYNHRSFSANETCALAGTALFYTYFHLLISTQKEMPRRWFQGFSKGYVVVVLWSGCTSGTDAFSLPSYQPDNSPTVRRFLEFLEGEECEGLGAIEIGYHQGGLRGLFATQDFNADEYILAVPFLTCVLVYENVYDIANENGDASDVEKGALLLERLKNDGDGHWQPYFDCLPTVNSNFDATPDFWEEETIRQLEVPRLVQDTLELKHATKASSELQFATWLVRSRAFSTFKLLPDANEKRIRTRTVLIPFLDFLNHGAASQSNARIEKIEAKNESESFFALVATREIASGEQVTITYGTGHETTLDLFTKYGFWTSDNPNDISLNLEGAAWSSSLDEDELLLEESSNGEMRDMLALRAHLKRVQIHQHPSDEK